MDGQVVRSAIRIPADAAHVAAVRAFVGAIGRQAGCTEESVDDLRLAASEACAHAIDDDAASDGIEVRARVERDTTLVIEIEPVGSLERSDEAEPSWTRSTRLALIRALFPEDGSTYEQGVLRLTARSDR